MKELLRRCSVETGCELQMAETVVSAFLAEISQELLKGNKVDLGENFGVFNVKYRSGELPKGSRRTTPKQAHYCVFFRAGRGLKNRLKQFGFMETQAEPLLQNQRPSNNMAPETGVKN